MPEVVGQVLLDGWRGEPGPATVYVRLLDTSRMDAPALVVDEVILDEVWLDQIGDDGIEFRLAVEEVRCRVRYQVSALVDLDGDGRISVGDYASTRSYPVLTGGFPNEVEVHVQPIG